MVRESQEKDKSDIMHLYIYILHFLKQFTEAILRTDRTSDWLEAWIMLGLNLEINFLIGVDALVFPTQIEE